MTTWWQGWTGWGVKEVTMRSQSKLLAILCLVIFPGSFCCGATITGTVKGPDGSPFPGAFVEAQNTKTKITVMSLSDDQGHYQVEKLPAGEYRVQVRAVGYRSNPQNGLNPTAEQNAPLDIALQKGTVHWNDLSIYQAGKLWPASTGKDLIVAHCYVCHGFQTRMASVTRDEDGWRDRVQYMRDAMHFSLSWRFTDHDAADVASYLTNLFGPDSALPKSPAEMPGYQETVRKFSSEAMKIVYVEYEMPGPSRMPFSAAPDKNGYLWIPNFGVANKISRLDPKTGEIKDFPVPNVGTAAVHSAVAAADGTVWLTEQAPNKLGRWDPTSQEITEYQDKYLSEKEGNEDGGSKHTLRFDPGGNVWATGYPLSRFDRKTGKFTDFWDQAAHTYGLEPDKDGNIWFTNPGTGQIGKVDWKTLKIMQWTAPTKGGYERRIELDSNGIVWFGEYETGKIGRFDPSTQVFREYDLPTGPQTHPYGLGIDRDNNVWYSSYYFDELGVLDPKTGKITEYPFPHSENTIREFFRDSEGRMWYGSPSNNKVGYFYLTAGPGGPSVSATRKN
jgi:virginiamycin B lyase